uniref:alpha-amylase n=1 Tax=Tetraodon nigroviridis TaxID=99883 RepID=H3DBM7_TETNG
MKFFILVALLGLSFAQHNPHLKHGRTSIVHLFEWRWSDIAAECERFLGPNGFGGVQISPPNEHIVLNSPWRPWWQRYQPISYNLCSRSGSESVLRDMITRCNNVGVNSHYDAVCEPIYYQTNMVIFRNVVNGQPHSNWWDNNSNQVAFGRGNRGFIVFNNDDCNVYVKKCSWHLFLKKDLNRLYFQSKVVEFIGKMSLDRDSCPFSVRLLTPLLQKPILGLCGTIYLLESHWFSKGVKEYNTLPISNTEGHPLSTCLSGAGQISLLSASASWVQMASLVFRKWNNEKLMYTKNWGEGWGFMPNGNAVVFIDNHDNQRGHGAGGAAIVTFWESRLQKMAVAYMLAHPYGVTRVMSSFRWNRHIVNGKDQNDWMGPPSHPDGSTKSVPINPDETCGDGWVCEHRWRQIKNMVIFRNVVNGQPHSNWWDNNSNQVAFGRGNRGFIIFNNDDWDLDVTLNTGLPAGTYCDVISGQKEAGRCTGKQIHVGSDGRAHFRISNRDEDPFVAIHVESKL